MALSDSKDDVHDRGQATQKHGLGEDAHLPAGCHLRVEDPQFIACQIATRLKQQVTLRKGGYRASSSCTLVASPRRQGPACQVYHSSEQLMFLWCHTIATLTLSLTSGDACYVGGRLYRPARRRRLWNYCFLMWTASPTCAIVYT
jgi:hypothetical protein